LTDTSKIVKCFNSLKELTDDGFDYTKVKECCILAQPYNGYLWGFKAP
jgi:hypothetical protein